MQIKHRFKQLAALALSISMALLCMPVGAMPEDITTPTDLAPDETIGSMTETDSVPSEDSDPEPPPTADPRHPLAIAIAEYGAIYVPTIRQAGVFSDPRLNADSLIFTTAGDVFLLLATRFTEHNTLQVWFLDADGNVVSGYVSADNLSTDYLLTDDVLESSDLPGAESMTDIGRVQLFVVNGEYPVAPDVVAEEAPVTEMPAGAEESEPSEITSPIPEDDASTEEILPVPENEPQPDDVPILPEETTIPETPSEPEGQGEPDTPSHAEPGAYIGVTTDTRVFAAVDDAAAEDYLTDEYLGNFVKDATVQVLSVVEDASGEVWYQVRFLYGDDFANGLMKWTDYATCWVMATEACTAMADSCTVTDFAYTRELLQLLRETQPYTTAMEGFTLKNISGSVGGFYAGQTGLYGSSGKDSAYPQLAKSAAHGTIYATPHYLEGYTVYCLEHNLSGPGEGSGSSQSAKGPYALVDMDYFVSNPEGGGVTGVQFSARTMHALAWVLRHSYPFMALNRSDANNEVWSRAAGQFAMREVIKQLEGAQYVRSYWDMDSFYAFSGGAPAVYLTYARWLAVNAMAHANITGNITASNQSVSISGSNYIGSVTLTTDADLIRIPRSVGTLTGHTGGSDSSYYYAKSGDTIRVTSSQSRFAITMESVSSADEEACFLVGIPSVSIQKVLVPVYGNPYPLKSASVTFELSYGEIRVTKQSTDGLLLKDAVFELLNGSGAVVATAATDGSGSAVFPGLQPGSYTIREKTAPQGYSLAASVSQSMSVVAGVTSTVTFVNERITGRIRIVKTDSITGRPLAGVVFSVTRLSGPASDNAADIGKVVATVTTNAQGVAETGLLPWGEYRLTETGVPAGYLDSSYTTTVWIK